MSTSNAIDGTTNMGVTGANITTDPLRKLEGFLKRAGHLAGIAVSDIARLALPIVSALAAISPKMSAPEAAFVATVELISNAVIAVEQKWATLGTATGAQKLADVLELVEQPVLALFAEAGIVVDTGYILNLVNAIVALLNAQPGDALALFEKADPACGAGGGQAAS